ncbi:hypothetical protein EV193_11372 [Herbihabitans rhizosphaerae]|uniref:Uncharacterized protein n=1 Tax=Herbihabitans rhizosphaerae TaxID=1872711 RepID=A0A4Q7KHA0_9PSEU|nr:hypothetical protein EV193_11372 [Herbihabitans rhizosphaerae]
MEPGTFDPGSRDAITAVTLSGPARPDLVIDGLTFRFG